MKTFEEFQQLDIDKQIELSSRGRLIIDRLYPGAVVLYAEGPAGPRICGTSVPEVLWKNYQQEQTHWEEFKASRPDVGQQPPGVV